MSSFKNPETLDSSTKDPRDDVAVPVSPTAPPYSPISPVMSNIHASQNVAGGQYATPPQIPQPQPISESDNPDAIALRSAISILQIQRQQSLRDLQALERQKRAAVADPKEFAKEVASGKVRTASTDVLDQSLPATSMNEDAVEDEEVSTIEAQPAAKASKFEVIPGPQKIVRCPPVNWAKYHVIGQPLNKLHEEQRKRPSGGRAGLEGREQRGEEHMIAAPYNPWKDKL